MLARACLTDLPSVTEGLAWRPPQNREKRQQNVGRLGTAEPLKRAGDAGSVLEAGLERAARLKETRFPVGTALGKRF